MPETITIELSEGEFLALHEVLRRPAVKNAMGINLNGGQAGFLRHALNRIEETERERLIADAKARGEMSIEELGIPGEDLKSATGFTATEIACALRSKRTRRAVRR